MLRPARFAGDEKTILKAAEAVWRDFAKSVTDVVLDTDGRLAQIHTRRLITFLDTTGQHLNRASYIFRERRDIESGEYEVTLKCRHPDRYVAQNRNMEASDSGSARTKFEEDIKVPFASLYSFSTTLGVDEDRTFKKLGDVARLFPDTSERLDGFRNDGALTVVNGFTAHKLVIAGGKLRIGKSPKVSAECALIVGYDHNRRQTKPVAVELSYRYGDKDENYGGTMSRRAFDVFHALQTKLGKWVDPKPLTKTALVYR
jgi:hypothetical protein